MAGIVKTWFYVHEAAALTGFTKDMLDYLATEGIFVHSGSPAGRPGVRRKYTYADVVVLRVLSEICARSRRIKHLKDALAQFRVQVGAIKPGTTLRQRLVVEGNELCLYSPQEGARILRNGQMTFGFFVVDMAQVTGEIASCVRLEPNGGFRLEDETAALAEAGRQRAWGRTQEWRARIGQRKIA